MSDAIISIKRLLAPALLGISIAIFLLMTVFPSSNKITHGFAAYYTASHLVLEHRGGPIFYEDKSFQAEVESLTGGRASDIYWANPPTTVLMMMPIATLSVGEARYVWIGISLIFLFLSVALSGLVIFKVPFQTQAFYWVTSFLLLSAPLAANFQYGQAYVLILAFYAIALFALGADLDWLAGFFLALTLALKASGWPLLVLLAIRGKWRLITWTLLAFITLVLLSIPLVGFSTWRIYLFNVIPNFLTDPVSAVTAYQTVPGFIRHLFIYDRTWNPSPLTNWPVFADIVGWLITFALVAIAGLRSKRFSIEWTFCIGLLLSVILIPVAEQHHYVLLFPAFLFAISSPQLMRVPVVIAGALIALPLAFTSNALSQGWLALIAYPRLYGAIILFVTLHSHNDDLYSPVGALKNSNAILSA